MAECEELIMSEEVADFIGIYNANREEVLDVYRDFCPQIINDRYVCFYEKREELEAINVQNFPYASIPKLYGLMDTTAAAATNAIRLQNQQGFELTGRDVIIGFIDTGIDYTNSLFKLGSGQTRIISIWDQTDTTGNPPESLAYGSEYTKEDIDIALLSDNPYEVVPHRDENGHGTFLAGVAAGRYNEQQDFIGTAPDSLIAVVKLKEAKQYLKDYFFLGNDTVAYQENDIMLAVSYLKNLQIKYNKPVVYVIGVGSGSGDRSGGAPLAQLLNEIGNVPGNCVVVCSGNEGNGRLHFGGSIEDGQTQDCEIIVGQNTQGFVIELWGRSPDIYSVSFVSPLGESVPRIPARKGISETVNFLIERTIIEIAYSIVESETGAELIFIRFINPSPGIWTIGIYGSNILSGRYNIWGNLRQFTNENTYFLKPEPNTTLTIPSGSEYIITVGGYDHVTNSFYPPSGRGMTSDGEVKPDFVAPAVNVFGPGQNQSFIRKSGTSVAVALAAGCCAQMLQWGIVDQNEPLMNTNYIKNYMIRGSTRDRDIIYPSSQWGYGKIDVFNSFLILTTS